MGASSIGISITSSSCIIDQAQWKDNQLEYETLGSGFQEIHWNKKHEKPNVSNQSPIKHTIDEKRDFHSIRLTTNNVKSKVTIKKTN